MKTSELIAKLRRTMPRDSGYAEQANQAADRLDAIEKAWDVWLRNGGEKHSDFTALARAILGDDARGG